MRKTFVWNPTQKDREPEWRHVHRVDPRRAAIDFAGLPTTRARNRKHAVRRFAAIRRRAIGALDRMRHDFRAIVEHCEPMLTPLLDAVAAMGTVPR